MSEQQSKLSGLKNTAALIASIAALITSLTALIEAYDKTIARRSYETLSNKIVELQSAQDRDCNPGSSDEPVKKLEVPIKIESVDAGSPIIVSPSMWKPSYKKTKISAAPVLQSKHAPPPSWGELYGK